MLKKTAVFITLCFLCLTFIGCGNSTQINNKAKTKLPKLNMKNWHYKAKSDVYYQYGVKYCEHPADKRLEKLSIFVPGKYMKAKKNGKDTYTCVLNKSAKIKSYTSADAPIVMPIDAPFYASHTPFNKNVLDTYRIIEGISEFTSKGFVYIDPGCRGAEHGAPAGVTDLKAVIRYLRFSDDVIAGDSESIFVFGVSGGGALSTILGASGDSKLYDPYLNKIGAVQGVSDSVAGSMSWCPITNLKTANAEHEWMMGCTRSGQTKTEKAVSDKLAAAYADYINKAGFTDKNGNNLTLQKSKDGIFQAGSYYEYIKSVIEQSLNNFLRDANFKNSSRQEYIDSLNAEKKWVTYNKSTNTVKISSIADFAKKLKRTTRYPVAFDQPELDTELFGNGKGKGAHFDRILADILTKEKSKYARAYNADLKKKDSFGSTIDKRIDMYSPLYYLMKNEKGYGESTVAKYWRIRSGIEQPHTSLTTEVNLALALEKNDGIKNVDFATVWAQDHTQAERKGSYTANFIKWVNACMNK